MYLEKIELTGFKSLANRTILEFKPGLTCIVGPNGSGKSNIVDAIRWATGEQGLKNLRGKKSEDVIFSGSEKRARGNLAEVSLFLNNHDHRLPLEYETVAISRRIYRDGENEYLINQQKVKLQDIVLLLAQANFGQKSYGIIGQGMTDYILTCSPLERKDFFDEAAGVKHFQIKREAAVRKLERSRQNLQQGELTLAEIEPRLKLLARQVNKLRQRQEIEVKLRALQRYYYQTSWQGLEDEREKLTAVLETQSVDRACLENEINELQEKMEQMSRGDSRTEVFDQLQNEYNELLRRKEKIMTELAGLQQKIGQDYASRGQQNLIWLENKIRELHLKVAALNEKISALENQNTAKTGRLEQDQRELSDLKNQLAILQNNLEAAQNQSGGQSGTWGAAWLEGVKTILAEQKNLTGICGLVGDLGQIKPEHETCLAVAAGNKLTAIVTEDENAAIAAIAYLKTNRLPTVTFIPLNKIRAYGPTNNAPREALDWALNLVDYDPRYQKAFEFVFGETLVVADTAAAQSLGVGDYRMVTLEGDLFEKSGLLRGGYRPAGSARWPRWSGQSALPATHLDLATIKRQIVQQAEKYQNLLKLTEETTFTLKINANQIQQWQDDLTASAAEIKNLELDLRAQTSSDPTQQAALAANLRERREALDQELAAEENKIQTIRQQINSFNANEEEKKQQLFNLQRALTDKQKQADGAGEVLSNTRVAIARLETKKDDLAREIWEELNTQPPLEFDTAAAEIKISLSQAQDNIRQLKRQLENIGGLDDEIEKEYETVNQRFEFISQQTTDLRATIESLTKLAKELERQINEGFNLALKKINEHFDYYFKKLFDGGRAHLALIQNEKPVAEEALDGADGDNTGQNSAENGASSHSGDTLANRVAADEPAEGLSENIWAGLEIEVVPPGKKMRHLAALSGGEKSMAALALVCAVIAYNPPPFVILDEADAALDESNTQKFAGILKHLSEKTQFIAITHNRVTMEQASILYGITLDTDNTSRILSVSLEEAKQKAAR